MSPDASGSIKAALLKLRRAQLTRFVKAVVLASLILCVAAVGRAAASAMTSEAEAHAAAPAVRAPQDLAPSTVRDGVDSLTDRTVRAMAAPPAESRRAPSRATAARHKRW